MSNPFLTADTKCKKHIEVPAVATCIMCQAPTCEPCTQRMKNWDLLQKIAFNSTQGYCPACYIPYLKRKRVKAISTHILTSISIGVLAVLSYFMNDLVSALTKDLVPLLLIFVGAFGVMFVFTLINAFVIWPKRFKNAKADLAKWA